MFYVYRIVENVVLVVDTNDGVVERYTKDDLLEISKQVRINGVTGNKIEPFDLNKYIDVRMASDRLFGVESIYRYVSYANGNTPDIVLEKCYLSKSDTYRVLDGTTKIAKNAFDDEEGGVNTFSYTVVLPKSCWLIAERVFYGTGLCKINLDNVVDIGKEAFRSCQNLKSITLSGRKPTLKVNYDGVKVGESAFSHCRGLKSVYISCHANIYEMAFAEAHNLTTVALGADTLVHTKAFKGCKSLININSEKITTLATASFKECTSLKSVDLSGLRVIETSNNARPEFFEGCSSLEYVKWKKEAVFGHNGAFFGCTSLKRIDNVTRVVDDIQKSLPHNTIAFHNSDTKLLERYFRAYKKLDEFYYFSLSKKDTANQRSQYPEDNVVVYKFIHKAVKRSN